MFENLFYQDAGNLLRADFERKTLPGAILLCGSEYSGKLSAALELSRVLLCRKNPSGEKDCDCPSCVRSRVLLNPNVLLLGPKNDTLEIAAAKNTFLRSCAENAPYTKEAQKAFIIATRKLLARFNEMLWQNDNNASKISAIVSQIADNLDEIDFSRTLPEQKKIEKICDAIEKDAQKLESTYLYDSIPVSQIRNVEQWANITSDSCRVVIMENADRMQDSVRNALLKTLEEPPERTIFILTTTNKGAILPTILSRVRLYSFSKRTDKQESEIVEKLFHTQSENLSAFFQQYLSVSKEVLQEAAKNFLKAAVSANFAQSASIVKECASFEPRVLLKLFFNEAASILRPLMKSAVGVSALSEINEQILLAYQNVSVFNQSPEAALDVLLRRIYSINRSHSDAVGVVLQF